MTRHSATFKVLAIAALALSAASAASTDDAPGYARNGKTLTGNFPSTGITIEAGATVTFAGVYAEYSSDGKKAAVACVGDATIILAPNTRNVVSNYMTCASAIYVPPGHTLTIKGEGYLEAVSVKEYCSAIGACSKWMYMNNDNGRCGNIVIAGGKITAIAGGAHAAAIGAASYKGKCGDITICGNADVTAESTFGAAAIGAAGTGGTCGDITIKDNASVKAAAGGKADDYYANGAGIGAGNDSPCGNIVIATTGRVVATGAPGTWGGAGIGAGGYSSDTHDSANCGDITISSGTIVANGNGCHKRADRSHGNGIGCTEVSSCGIIRITGGNITATGAANAAGIGANGTNSAIVIEGGTVKAIAGPITGSGPYARSAAAVGSSGVDSHCGDITITGGSCDFEGGADCPGIGRARHGSSCGTVTIGEGVTLVKIMRGQRATDYIAGITKDRKPSAVIIAPSLSQTYSDDKSTLILGHGGGTNGTTPDSGNVSNVGLAAHWPLDGNANDASGNGNHGKVEGATLTSDRNGKANAAYHFDGSKCDAIRVPSSPSLKGITSVSTIAAWIKPERWDNTWVNVFSKGEQKRQYGLFAKDSGTLYMNDSYRNDSPDVSAKMPEGLKLGVWQHVAIVYDGSKTVAYVNGKPGEPKSTSGQFVPNDEDFMLGRDDYVDRENYWGDMDDVRIYNRALSASEIVALAGVSAAGTGETGGTSGRGETGGGTTQGGGGASSSGGGGTSSSGGGTTSQGGSATPTSKVNGGVGCFYPASAHGGMLRQEPVKMPDTKRAPDYLNPDGTPVGSEQKPSAEVQQTLTMFSEDNGLSAAEKIPALKAYIETHLDEPGIEKLIDLLETLAKEANDAETLKWVEEVRKKLADRKSGGGTLEGPGKQGNTGGNQPTGTNPTPTPPTGEEPPNVNPADNGNPPATPAQTDPGNAPTTNLPVATNPTEGGDGGKKPGTTGGGGDEPQPGGGKKPEEDPEGYIPPDWDGENKTEVVRVQPPWKYEDGEPKTAETNEKPPEGMELVGYRKLREIQVYCIKNNGAPFKYKIDGKELKKKVREPKNILASPVSLCCDMDEFTGYDASSGKYHFGQSSASLKWTMPSERIDIYYSKEKGYRTFPSNLVFNCTGVSRAALRCSKYSGLKKNYSYKGMNIFVSAEPGKISVDYDLGKKHENDSAEFADAKKNRVIYRQGRSSYTSSFGTEPYAYSIADLDKKQKREMSATKTVTVDTNRGFGGGGYYYACIQAGLSNYCDFNAAGILPGDSYPGNGNIKSYVYFIYENRDPDVGPQEPSEPTKQEPEEEEEQGEAMIKFAQDGMGLPANKDKFVLKSEDKKKNKVGLDEYRIPFAVLNMPTNREYTVTASFRRMGAAGEDGRYLEADAVKEPIPYSVEVAKDKEHGDKGLWEAVIKETGTYELPAGTSEGILLKVVAESGKKGDKDYVKVYETFPIYRIHLGLSFMLQVNTIPCYLEMGEKSKYKLDKQDIAGDPEKDPDDKYVIRQEDFEVPLREGAMLLLLYDEDRADFIRIPAVPKATRVTATKVENDRYCQARDAEENHQELVDRLGIKAISTGKTRPNGSHVVKVGPTKGILDPPLRLLADLEVDAVYSNRVSNFTRTFTAKKKVLLHSQPMRVFENSDDERRYADRDAHIRKRLERIRFKIEGTCINRLFSLRNMIDRMIDGYDSRFGYDERQVKSVMDTYVGFIEGRFMGANGVPYKVTFSDDLKACYAFMQGLRDNTGFLGRMALGVLTGGVSEHVFTTMTVLENMQNEIMTCKDAKEFGFLAAFKIGAEEIGKQVLMEMIAQGAIQGAAKSANIDLNATMQMWAGRYRKAMDGADSWLQSKSSLYKAGDKALQTCKNFLGGGTKTAAKAVENVVRSEEEAAKRAEELLKKSRKDMSPAELKAVKQYEEAMENGLKKVRKLQKAQQAMEDAAKNNKPALKAAKDEYRRLADEVWSDKCALKKLQEVRGDYAKRMRAQFNNYRENLLDSVQREALGDIAKELGVPPDQLYVMNASNGIKTDYLTGKKVPGDRDISFMQKVFSDRTKDLTIDQSIGQRSVARRLWKKMHGGKEPPSIDEAMKFMKGKDVTYVNPNGDAASYVFEHNLDGYEDLPGMIGMTKDGKINKNLLANDLHNPTINAASIKHKGVEWWGPTASDKLARAAEWEALAAKYQGSAKAKLLEKAFDLRCQAVGDVCEGIRQITKQTDNIIVPRGANRVLGHPMPAHLQDLHALAKRVGQDVSPAEFTKALQKYNLDLNTWADQVSKCLNAKNVPVPEINVPNFITPKAINDALDREKKKSGRR